VAAADDLLVFLVSEGEVLDDGGGEQGAPSAVS
jgi:hypothetical protein